MILEDRAAVSKDLARVEQESSVVWEQSWSERQGRGWLLRPTPEVEEKSPCLLQTSPHLFSSQGFRTDLTRTSGNEEIIGTYRKAGVEWAMYPYRDTSGYPETQRA